VTISTTSSVPAGAKPEVKVEYDGKEEIVTLRGRHLDSGS
jgi:hypothetical protein